MRTEYVKQLINTKSKNFSQTLKEWGDEIYQYLVDNTDRDWSRNGITMMFGQLIVNSPQRVKLGSLRDMFVELEDGKVRPYYKDEDSNLKHYYYDRSKTNTNKTPVKKLSLDEFMEGYMGPDIDQFTPKPTPYKVLILTQCGKKKTIKN